MNQIDRYKIIVRHAINIGTAANQKELGKILGYNNESSFSQIINCKVDTPKDFIGKLKNIIPNLNPDWLLTGEGEMLNTSNTTGSIQGNNNTSIAGNGNKVHQPTDAEKFLTEMAEQRKAYTSELTEQRKLTEKAHEQMDRLLSQLEAKDAIINKLLK